MTLIPIRIMPARETRRYSYYVPTPTGHVTGWADDVGTAVRKATTELMSHWGTGYDFSVSFT